MSGSPNLQGEHYNEPFSPSPTNIVLDPDDMFKFYDEVFEYDFDGSLLSMFILYYSRNYRLHNSTKVRTGLQAIHRQITDLLDVMVRGF